MDPEEAAFEEHRRLDLLEADKGAYKRRFLARMAWLVTPCVLLVALTEIGYRATGFWKAHPQHFSLQVWSWAILVSIALQVIGLIVAARAVLEFLALFARRPR
jgi:hypothetical protein